MQIEIKGLKELQTSLGILEDKTADTKPLLKELGNHLVNVIEESFQNEASPDGIPWSPIKPRKSDKTPDKILYDDGNLQDSLKSRVHKNSLLVGVNATSKGYQYPLVHQFGTQKAGKNRNITIVARPFMPIKSDGYLYESIEKELEQLVEDYIEEKGVEK